MIPKGQQWAEQDTRDLRDQGRDPSRHAPLPPPISPPLCQAGPHTIRRAGRARAPSVLLLGDASKTKDSSAPGGTLATGVFVVMPRGPWEIAGDKHPWCHNARIRRDHGPVLIMHVLELYCPSVHGHHPLPSAAQFFSEVSLSDQEAAPAGCPLEQAGRESVVPPGTLLPGAGS